MEYQGLYEGYTVTVIGGVRSADYDTALKRIGFECVYRAYNRKDFGKLGRQLRESDLAIFLKSASSHKEYDMAFKKCGQCGVPLFSVPRSAGPNHLANYLLERHEDITSKLEEA